MFPLEQKGGFMFLPKNYLYTIVAKRKEYFIQLLNEENLNQMEIEILMFLHKNPNSNTLTDIINAKDFTKSHASTAISNLESKGYLSKSTTLNNKKTLHLTLLPISEPLVKKALNCAQNFQKKALVGITERELNEMNRLLAKVCDNLKEKK